MNILVPENSLDSLLFCAFQWIFKHCFPIGKPCRKQWLWGFLKESSCAVKFGIFTITTSQFYFTTLISPLYDILYFVMTLKISSLTLTSDVTLLYRRSINFYNFMGHRPPPVRDHVFSINVENLSGTILYREHMVPDWQGSAPNEIQKIIEYPLFYSVKCIFSIKFILNKRNTQN